MDMHEKCNEQSHIKKVIAVVSGKGGVGKSTVTASLAAAMAQRGRTVGVLDADITGPSIPQAFGIHEKAGASEGGILPSVTAGGVRIMSLNLLTANETDPVIWRGPVLAGVVKQFWTDVVWGDVDYLFVDMPPGTGDVPLTVFQSLPVDGIIVVTSPQDLVSMIVTKAVRMAEMMDIPVLGFVENYSYFRCPDCGKEHRIFGESGLDELAQSMSLPVLARLPIDPAVAKAMDEGKIETFRPNPLAGVAEALDR
jgi:Mrp family chromosome partitioning ATPase